jgi:hypothetical protein
MPKIKVSHCVDNRLIGMILFGTMNITSDIYVKMVL